MENTFNVLVCILALLVGILIGKRWRDRKNGSGKDGHFPKF